MQVNLYNQPVPLNRDPQENTGTLNEGQLVFIINDGKYEDNPAATEGQPEWVKVRSRTGLTGWVQNIKLLRLDSLLR